MTEPHVDPITPELERIHEHQVAQLRAAGVNGFDELDRLRELLLPDVCDFKITWPGRENAPAVVPPSGPKYACSLGLTVSVEPRKKESLGKRTWICMKNKLQPWGSFPERRRVLEVELNGVFLYIEGRRVILTDTKMSL